MLILGQKSYSLGPTIFKIPQPNWYWIIYPPKTNLYISFSFSVSLQGFTAAQLSTESVSKLLSEEPSAQAGADLEYQLLEAAKAGKKILEPWVFFTMSQPLLKRS